MKKSTPRLLLLFALSGLAGCYNNAHLRTQQLLEPGEKVVSGSSVLALGGDSLRYGALSNTGVPGLRNEVSFLTGKRWGESGPYVGLGLNLGTEDIIAGYEIKRYIGLNTAVPWKLGLQAEGNLNFGGGALNPSSGFALHLRPSFTSATTRKRPYYGGLHGLFSLGSFEGYDSWMEFVGIDTVSVGDEVWYEYIYDWHKGDVPYQFYSFGAGVTAGYEKISRTGSTQMQVDASWVYGYYSTRGYTLNPRSPSRSPSSSTFMVTGSVGLNFFRPKPSPRRPAGPYPALPVSPQEVPKGATPGEGQPRYDPVTGLPVEAEPEAPATKQFDPETGLHKENEPEAPAHLRFDRETGEVDLEATPENVIATAEAEAIYNHNKKLHSLVGAAGCLLAYIILPITTLYVESGVLSGFDKNSASSAAAYYRGLSPELQLVYEQAYQNKVKSLRRRSVYGTQLFCFGAVLLMVGL